MNEPLTVQEAPASYQVILDTSRIRQGYKQTEVGVIPEDWDVVLIGSLGTFSKGQGVRKDESASGEIPCVRYGEIYTHHNDIVRVFNSFISVSVAKSSKRLKNGDLLFAGSGETKEEIGKCVVFVEDIEAYAGGDIVILSPIKGDSLFFGYLFNTPTIVRQKASKGQGDAVVHISATALSSIKTPLPPSKAEQRAIATALSDVDALLAAQDKLIAKKRDIKQAAMQQLLTGKQRLPGFTEEWEVKRLGDVGEIVTGSTPPTQIKEYWNGSIPWITPTDISDKKDMFSSEREITLLGLQVIRKLPADSLLVTCIASIGKNAILRKNGACNQQINAIIPNDNNSVEFLYYLIENSKNYLLGNAGITATLMISKKDFSEICFLLPPLEEQTAIATILSDMDADLSALEQQRDKTRALKQGMMQELLTGRIRLV